MVSQNDVLRAVEQSGWPVVFKEKLVLGNFKSNVAICTLWTFPDKVYDYLEKDKYALIGNLYDKKNGISPIVRNCLANPNIRYILVLGVNKSGSKEVLISLFEKGVDNSHTIIGTDIQVDKMIPIEEINKLIKNVKIIDMSSEIPDSDLDDSKKVANALRKKIDSLEKLEPFDKTKLFEKKEVSAEVMPWEGVSFTVRGKTVGEVWLRMLQGINRFGTNTKMKKTDSFNVREIVNLIAVVEEENPDDPKIYPFFRFDKKYLLDYYNEICTPKLPRGMVYTYGSRLRAWNEYREEKIDQIQDIIDYLKKDVFRKSAMATTWIVEDELKRRYERKDKNSPCIVLIQPNVQSDGKLHLTAYIRSNDMFRGWPQNAFALRKLQYMIADGLGVDVGKLTTISNSAHIYEDCWDETKEILKKYGKEPWCRWDPRGYYIVKVDGDKLVVTHYSPDGNELETFEGKSFLELTEILGKTGAASDPCHWMDLGSEIRVAEICMKMGKKYKQDNYNYDNLR